MEGSVAVSSAGKVLTASPTIFKLADHGVLCLEVVRESFDIQPLDIRRNS